MLKDTSAEHLIEKLDESATVSENLIYQITSFIQKFIYGRKTNEESVEMRIIQYNTMKTKTTQTILPDPHNLKGHMKRANLAKVYYWWHYLEYNIA